MIPPKIKRVRVLLKNNFRAFDSRGLCLGRRRTKARASELLVLPSVNTGRLAINQHPVSVRGA